MRAKPREKLVLHIFLLLNFENYLKAPFVTSIIFNEDGDDPDNSDISHYLTNYLSTYQLTKG